MAQAQPAVRPVKAYALALLAVVLLIFACEPGWGQSGNHNDGHSERHDWYLHLKQPHTGHSCCTRMSNDGKSGDCRPVRAWLDDDGTWIAVVDGRQMRVPEHVIIRTPGANHEPIYAHACVSAYGLWWCFLIPGPGG
jgi:hypothetical protein